MACGDGIAPFEARLAPSRVPWGAIAVIAAATALLWPLALPDVGRQSPYVIPESSGFRPEWLIAATLLALPLRRVTQWRIWAGLLLLTFTVAVGLVVADEGIDRLQWAGSGLPSEVVYVGLGMQLVLHCGYVTSGMRKRVFDRRWARMNRKLTARTSVSRSAQPDRSSGRPTTT